jgi:hypothetical protein
VLNQVLVDRMPLFRGLKVDCHIMNAHIKAVIASSFQKFEITIQSLHPILSSRC